MSASGEASVTEVGKSQIHGSWETNTPVKSVSSKLLSICTDGSESLVNKMFAPDSTSSGGLHNGYHNWEAALQEIPLPEFDDLVETTETRCCGDLNAMSNPSDSVFRAGFEGTRFEASSTPFVDKKFISIGQNMWINKSYFSTTPNDSSAPLRQNFDLNSPYKGPVDTVSRENSSSVLAPITPDKSKKSGSNQSCSNQATEMQLSKPITVVSSESSSSLFAPITSYQCKKNEKVQDCSNQMPHKQLSKPIDAVSSGNSSSVFAPITPDQSKNPEKSQAFSTLPTEKQLANGSTCDVVSTQVEENHNPDNDPQKTPEAKPKRRKHRPKVVKEGQAKRTRKPDTTDPEGNAETPTGKRKNVRKNGLNKSPGFPEAAAQGSEIKETPKVKRKYVRKNDVNKTPEFSSGEVNKIRTDTKTEPLAQKLCKKRLNFDENSSTVDGNSSWKPAQAQTFHIEVESKSPAQLGQDLELIGNTKMDLIQEVGAQEKNASRKGKCKIVFSDQTHDNQEPLLEVMMTNNTQPAPSQNYSNSSNNSCLYEGEEVRRLKRGRECTTNMAEQMCTNEYESHYHSMSIYMPQYPTYSYNDSTKSGMIFSTTKKRGRVCTTNGTEQICTNEYGSHYNAMSKYMAQYPTHVDNNSAISAINLSTTEKKWQSKWRQSAQETASYTSHNPYMASYVPETNLAYPSAQFYPNKYQKGTQSLLYAHLQEQAFEYRLLLEHARMMRQSISNSSAQLCSLSSLTGHVESNQVPYYFAGGSSPSGDLQIYQGSYPSHACTEMKVPKARKPRKSSSKKSDVALKKKPTVDDITEYLKHLHIDPKYREKNALVLYGGVGTLVPFEGSFNPIKKRRERAKVDLDEETSRVWRLLLENINSEGIDGTDEEKAKWWEEERRVFQGRADSFIARMHLVQGDRRFSPWKGSVVDSVVGVFLTQNVSDHASSSAFMSLCAHFPLKKEGNSGSCSDEQEVQFLEPEDTINSFNTNGSSSATFMELLQMAESGKGFQNQESQSMPSYTEKVQHLQNCDLGFYNQSTLSRSIIPSVEKVPSYERSKEEILSPNTPDRSEENCASEQSEVTIESKSPETVQNVTNISLQTESVSVNVKLNSLVIDNPQNTKRKIVETCVTNHGSTAGTSVVTSEPKKGKAGKQKEDPVDWDMLRLKAEEKGKRERTANTMDSLDWEAVRRADVDEVAKTFKARGMSNVLAERIQAFLNRIAAEHGSIDLEWLRDVPPDKAKEYLLSIRGLGLKSVECVRLLTLHHLAFPVDTNVGRIAVRLGWVPLQPLPESLQLHLLELYPVLESIQQYLWPRLCKLDQRTLYELHYQLITFGKVFCTKSKPNCNACPMRGDCRHFASAFASTRLALPGLEEKRIVNATENKEPKQSYNKPIEPLMLPEPQPSQESQAQPQVHIWPKTLIVQEPIVEIPNSPEPEIQVPETDMEDMFLEDPEEIPTIRLNLEKFTQNLQNYMEHNMELQEGDVSKALVAISQEAASIPMPKLKNVNRLRTEHQVYELPDTHPLLEGMDRREPDDPCSYLLAIWTPGETANSFEQPESRCSSQESDNLCELETCFSCNSIREANSQTVRGTLLIPCRTAMRGSFPLNGTYFQVNEVFADHNSSLKPIDVPRSWIWNLPRRTVYFGTSITTIFKGLSTEQIQYCFWRGLVCVRGFDQKTRAPRPLMARFHFPASKLPKPNASNKPGEEKS